MPEPGRGEFEAEDHKPHNSDSRDHHGRNFLACVESREQPTYNPVEAHYATTVAHLGNLAYRTSSEVRWDPKNEKPISNPAAEALLRPDYRAPWKLPSA